jgi:N-methylhydantoinase A
MKRLGVDTGGTFTDFVLQDGEALRVHKVLSTPEAPERAILQGVRDLGVEAAELRVVHGSTVGTNAVLEGKGARTAYVTNRGLGDVLTIGRQARRELYNLQPPAVSPPVPAELCLETGGRWGADGGVVDDLTDSDLAALEAAVRRLGPEAVAINLLFSYRDDRFERAVADRLGFVPFVSRSSLVLPEYREYERGIATWVNARVGPLMQGYLERLYGLLSPASLTVMQSHGDTLAASEAGAHAVRLLLSGPAGGLNGARFLAAASGVSRLLTFDMGGTSTDVALIDGEIRLTAEGEIGGYPLAVPMVDMHTIGAGGGSIADVDAGGLLLVGPHSAGASPGPACYGLGGAQPTVTDANLVLGRLPLDTRLAGGMPIFPDAARSAVARLASRMGLSVEEAALGIIQVVNEHMVGALRRISLARGEDPRAYTLLPFGGAGGLHVCELAASLGMTEALLPVHAGVLSALGMLVAPRGRQLSRTLGVRLDLADTTVVEAVFGELEARGRAELMAEGVTEVHSDRMADLRYEGQSSTLRLPWSGVEQAGAAFHRAHEARFGHALELPVELVNVRVGLTSPAPLLSLPKVPAGPPARAGTFAPVHGLKTAVPVYAREDLPAGQRLCGPALITEPVATTWIAPGWHGEVDEVGNVRLKAEG